MNCVVLRATHAGSGGCYCRWYCRRSAEVGNVFNRDLEFCAAPGLADAGHPSIANPSPPLSTRPHENTCTLHTCSSRVTMGLEDSKNRYSRMIDSRTATWQSRPIQDRPLEPPQKRHRNRRPPSCGLHVLIRTQNERSTFEDGKHPCRSSLRHKSCPFCAGGTLGQCRWI